MLLISLIEKNHFLFLIGTSDNEYNLFFLNRIQEQLNSTSEFVSLSPTDFIQSSTHSAPLLLINDIDRYLDQFSSTEIQNFFNICHSLKIDPKTKVIFFIKPKNLNFSIRYSQIKNLFNESLYFIPNPDASTQLSFFSESTPNEFKDYLLKFFETKTTPIFIIGLASRVIENFFGKNFSFHDFQKIGGFEGLVNLAGKNLEDALVSSGARSELINFFRPFIHIDLSNHWSLVNQSKDSIIAISKTSVAEVENFLDEAIDFGFVKESMPGKFEIASESLAVYWAPLNKWILHEIKLVNKYRELQKMAIQYHAKMGLLLSPAQIDEVISWKTSFPYSNAWGEQYAPETEIIWNFIDYSILINDAHKEAETRKVKRLIKMTRAVAAVIGIAFILSFVAAIYAGIERKKAVIAQNIAEEERLRALQSKEEADLQRIKAEEASKAESLAKIAAEKDRQTALLASEIAILEKQKALIAKNIAESEKEKAEIAKKDAEQAKVLAEKAREKAILAQEAEQEALAISMKNFENAERLRLQQTASNMGLNASQLIREMKFNESLIKAVEAFQLNLDNSGFTYEPAIAKALIESNTKFNALEYSFPKPIKKIQWTRDGQRIICLFLDDELIEFNLDSEDIRIIAKDVKSFVLEDDNSLWITTKTYQVLTYNFINQLLERQNYPFPTTGLLGVIPPFEFLEDALIIRENGVFTSTGRQIITLANNGFKTPSFEINPDYKLLLLKEASGLNIFRQSSKITFGKIDAILLPNQEKIMSFDFIDLWEKIIIGAENGNVYLYDLKQKSLTTIGNFHDSRISYLKTVKVLDTELIISASYDHTWKLTPIDFSTNQLGQSVTFQAHSGWITSASYNESTNQLITAGNDKVLFKWHINLEEIVNKFNKI